MTEWNDEHGQQPQHDDRYDEPKSGAGKVLSYFFAVVILCAISLGIGYMMGKRAVPDAPAQAASEPAALSGAAKPGASRAEALPVETAAPPVETMPAPTTAATEPKTTKAPELAVNPAKGIMVQVAAVTRAEDADILASALRKKKYPVFVVPPAGGDKFYRVQVGPFAALKDADAMKAKLASDGYNAIVKK